MSGSEEDKEQFSVNGLADHLKYKVPLITLGSGVSGAAAGYYIGGLTALYGYGFGIGGGVFGSAFYLGTYSLRCLRERDDGLNYAISGGVNAGWMTTGLYGIRRGVLAVVVGACLGAVYRLIGEQVYQVSRRAWIEHRRHGLYRSAHRVLTVRKPQFPPREGVLAGPTRGIKKDN